MNCKRLIPAFLAAIPAALLSGCGTGNQEVTRVDPGAVADVNYRFNDTDARQVWQGMVDDATFRNWTDRWRDDHNGKRPTIIVGNITNNTQDVINMNLFTRNFEREMLNSGKVRVVAMRDQRGQIRDERLQGEEWNSPQTRKQMKNEQGADLILMGDINDVKQTSADGRTLVIAYEVNLDLTDLESNEKAWIGTVDIKKVVRR
jgi:penicillin-binding protein activator